MCYFITVAVHGDYDRKLQERLKAGYTISKCKNPSLRGLFPEGFNAYEVTTGMCSCDLYSKPQDPEREAEKIRRKYGKPKYKKRGWSEARIEQAVKDRMSSIKLQENGLGHALRDALSDIAEESGTLYLVVHWYSGDVDKKRLSRLQDRSALVDALMENDWAIEEDTLINLKMDA